MILVVIIVPVIIVVKPVVIIVVISCVTVVAYASIASENTKDTKKEVLTKGLNIVKNFK